MAKKLNLTQQPYFDDYKESNKYYQILFRPGRAVQARELTQLQTILQNQIERFGTHIFKQGSNVIPGTANAVRYTKTVHYIKLPLQQVYPEYSPLTSSVDDIDSAIKDIWINKKIAITSGDRVGISGTIKGYRGPDQIGSTTGGEVRFFLTMESASEDGTSSTFQKGDLVTIVNGERTLSATIPSTEGLNKVGLCSSVQVEEGVYFYNGYFVYVDGQTIYLAPTSDESADTELYQNLWSDVATASVGLLMTESVVTSQKDASLLDNATGTPNYSAPGADRFKIDAKLVQLEYDPNSNKPENFVSLIDIVAGKVFFIVDAPDYAVIADTLARRTFDESGDYVVENLGVEVTEFLLDEETQTSGAHQITEFQFISIDAAKAYSKEKFGVDEAIQHPAGTELILGKDAFFYPGTSYDGRTDPTSFKKLCESYLTIKVDPGKAYVKGYEIRKLARTSVDIPKSRTTRFVDNATISTPIGSYVLVKDVAGNVNIGNFAEVSFYDTRRVGTKKAGTGVISGSSYIPAEFTYDSTIRASSTGVVTTNKVGTAKIIKIEPDGESGAGFYRVYLTDVSFLPGFSSENIKTLYSATEQFIAHAELLEYDLTGSIQKSSSTAGLTFTGTGTGWKNFPGEILKVNDYVYLTGNSTGHQQYYRVKSIASDSTIELESEELNGANTGTSGTITSTTLKGVYTIISSAAEENGLLFRLGQNYISNVRTITSGGSVDVDTTTMEYTIEELFAGTSGTGAIAIVDSDAGTYTIQITTPHTFDSNEYTYKVVKKSSSGTKSLMSVANSPSTPSGTGTVNVNASLNNKTLTFYFSAADGATATGNSFFIMVPVIKSGLKEKTKVLKLGSFNSGNYTHTGNTTGVTGKGVKVVTSANNSDIRLDECDVFQVTRIVASKDSGTTPTTTQTLNDGDIDVTALYEFHSGQKEYYYDFGRVTLKPGYPRPSGQVRVEYDYFDHVSTNNENSDYFSVDSYLNDTGVPYDEIPKFKSNDGSEYALADCIDFRKKITDATSGRAPIDFFTCDFFCYNSRKDKIVLDSKTKTFQLLSGVPGIEPNAPEDADFGMTLAELRHLPYGLGKQSCLLKPRDNRRYTMRDIGRLEKRIENLEYYTSLSLLEAETSKLNIPDANGNNRFKNGFLVDSFSSFESSALDNDDFSCSISPTLEHVARPLVFSDNFRLEEDLLNVALAPIAPNLRNKADSGTAYTKTGDLYTLPFTRVEFVSQGIATKVINVNPFAVFTYVGRVQLTPWSDIWRETKYSERVIFDDSAYRDALSKYNGQLNYDRTTSYPSVSPILPPKRLGRKLLEGGHIHFEKMSPKERKEVLKTKKFRVPKGWINEGEIVTINTHGKAKIAYVTKQTWTTTTKTIRESFQSEVIKTGITSTSALTKDQTTEIEYMRTREVQFNGTGFRPNTNLYSFFDNRPVSKYCRPVKSTDSENFVSYSVLDVTDTSGEVSVLPVDSPIRYFKITTGTFPTGTGVGKVRVGCEVQFTTSSGIIRKFDIVNVSSQYIICLEKTREGLLAAQFGGRIAPAGTTLTAKVTKYAYGDQLQADGRGSIQGVFLIPSPNPASIAHVFSGAENLIGFKTGQTQFILSSSSINAQTGPGISRGATNFESRGTLTSQELTITQTQQFSVSQQSNRDEAASSKETTIYDQEEPEYVDPIAQTFNVRETGGCFITDVEVFFAKKPTKNPVPVRLELRTVSATGVPERVLVGGRLGNVVKQANEIVVNKVDISSSGSNTLTIQVDPATAAETFGAKISNTTGKVCWDNNTSVKADVLKRTAGITIEANTTITSASDMGTYMVPTRFTFESPIYLEQNKQYAFVILSDSDEYETWVAQRGNYGPLDQNIEYGYYDQVGDTNVKIGTTESIDNQELYVEGNFFKSKNGAAWTPDDTTCMKFNIGKARFRTRTVTPDNTIANVGEIVYVNETVDWTTLGSNALEVRPGSNQIRVLCPNHGASVNDRVRFAIDLPEGDLRGFTKVALQSEDGLVVVNTELDYFTVTTGSTTTGYKASDTLARQQYLTGAYKSSGVGATLIPTVKIRINKRFDQLTLMANSFCPQGTSIQWTLQTVAGSAINEYATSGSLVTRDSQNKLAPVSVAPGVPVEFNTPMLINSPENEPEGGDFDGAQPSQQRLHIQTKKSVIVKALLISNNENISPVLDQSRLGATTVANRLDNPSGVAGPGRNNINNTTFDTLTIFDKNAVPSDKNLNSSNVVVDVPRAPTYSGSNILSDLSFSTARKTLTGTFKQDTNSKIIEAVSTDTKLVSEVNPGDKLVISNGDLTDERTVVRVVSDKKLILNAPFTAPFNPGSLALIGEYMEITTSVASIADHLSQLDIGKYISIELYPSTSSPPASSDNTAISSTADTRVCANKLILGVDYTPESSTTKCKITVEHLHTGTTSGSASRVTIKQLDRYIDEIGHKGNSGGTRYICKKLNLDRASTALKISFDGLRDEYSSFELYYRTELPSDSTEIDDKSWKKATFNIEVDGVLTPKTPAPNDAVYQSYEATIEALESFKGVQAKVVMKGGNSAKPPKIKNFRLIALDE